MLEAAAIFSLGCLFVPSAHFFRWQLWPNPPLVLLALLGAFTACCAISLAGPLLFFCPKDETLGRYLLGGTTVLVCAMSRSLLWLAVRATEGIFHTAMKSTDVPKNRHRYAIACGFGFGALLSALQLFVLVYGPPPPGNFTESEKNRAIATKGFVLATLLCHQALWFAIAFKALFAGQYVFGVVIPLLLHAAVSYSSLLWTSIGNYDASVCVVLATLTVWIFGAILVPELWYETMERVKVGYRTLRRVGKKSPSQQKNSKQLEQPKVELKHEKEQVALAEEDEEAQERKVNTSSLVNEFDVTLPPTSSRREVASLAADDGERK